MILGFKKRFAPLVADGSKRHTIRDDAGDRWKAGKIAHPYRNVRQRGMSLIIDPRPVIRVERIEVHRRIASTGRGLIVLAGVWLTSTEADAFAWADGFRWKPNGDPYLGEGLYTNNVRGCFDLMLEYWKKKDGKNRPKQYVGKVVYF